jgi:hypothetical protein
MPHQVHGAGVFHRDPPQNLFLARDKKQRTLVKVSTSAREVAGRCRRRRRTGTPAHCAGAAGSVLAHDRGATRRIATQVSAGTDVWAMGLVQWTAPLRGLWARRRSRRRSLEPTPSASARGRARSAAARGFDAWPRCLDLDAAKRFASAGEAAAALLPSLRAGGSAAAQPVTAAPRTPATTPFQMPAHTPAPSPLTPPAHALPHPHPSAGPWVPQAQSAPREPFASQPSLAAHAAPLALGPSMTRRRAPHAAWQGQPGLGLPGPGVAVSPPAPGAWRAGRPALSAWARSGAELRQPTDPRVPRLEPVPVPAPIHGATRDVRIQLNDAQVLTARCGRRSDPQGRRRPDAGRADLVALHLLSRGDPIEGRVRPADGMNQAEAPTTVRRIGG